MITCDKLHILYRYWGVHLTGIVIFTEMIDSKI